MARARPRATGGMAGAAAMGLLLGIGGGCRKAENAYVPPPPPEVTVAHPVRRRVPETLELTGITRGLETVEVRARVKGFLQTKHVEGGRRVKAGELLFTIDPRTFDAMTRQAQAEVDSMRASQRLAGVTLTRMETAMRSNAASQQELDKARADRDAAEAQLQLAEARLMTTSLDLEFTRVRAPINGRIGLIPVDEGQLVGATEATLLTTLINDEKIYATYDIDERTVLELRRSNENKRPGEDGRPNLVVRLGLANEVGYPHEGVFNKADNRVNPDTGTIRIEAIFDNTDGTLLPGLFVRLQPVLGERDAVLLPDVAVLTDQGGKYVLVVNGEGTVERRNVQVGPVSEHMQRIDGGVDTDAAVVVNGLQRARPGSKVNAKMAPPPTPPAGGVQTPAAGG